MNYARALRVVRAIRGLSVVEAAQLIECEVRTLAFLEVNEGLNPSGTFLTAACRAYGIGWEVLRFLAVENEAQLWAMGISVTEIADVPPVVDRTFSLLLEPGYREDCCCPGSSDGPEHPARNGAVGGSNPSPGSFIDEVLATCIGKMPSMARAQLTAADREQMRQRLLLATGIAHQLGNDPSGVDWWEVA